MTGTLLTLGHGYSAQALARRLVPQGWRILGTTRTADKAEALQREGVTPILWERDALRAALAEADHLLMSAAPNGPEGDPALDLIGPEIAAHAPRIRWAGYLSTTAVYGDHGGAWVDEDTPTLPASKRGRARVAAEQAWAAIPGLPVHIFRLAGIYGPGRGTLEKLRRGTAQRVIKPGQIFSRIHVDDIAQALEVSMATPQPGAIYNLCDDNPAPPQEVLAFAAELLELPLPPEVDFETAEMHPMARLFYSENKRVSNARIKRDLGLTLLYPDYPAGLRAVLAAEKG